MKKDEKQSLFVRGLLSVIRVLLILGLFVYVLYHLTNGFSAELGTEIVTMHTEQRQLLVSGAIVRSEKELDGSYGGVVSYRYENGTRVNKGAKLATVYGGTQDAKTVARVAEIDKMIDFLSDAGVDKTLSVSDGISAAKEISASYVMMSDGISRGDYSVVSDGYDELLKSFIVHSTALGKDEGGMRDALLALEKERSGLANSLSGETSTIKAPISGYFYDYSDGASEVFDYENITSLSVSEYKEGLNEIESMSSSAPGKIVLLPKWYFVCSLPKADCVGLSEGKTYSIAFSVSDMAFDMKLEAKNTEKDECLLVFSSKLMPTEFDFERIQKAAITVEEISGYRIPSSALRVVDGTLGVYVRSGNTVKFRVCDILYESGAYSYVNPETEGVTLYSSDTEPENDVYCKGLSLYDNVIISGAKELYPDRIVN